MAIILHGLVWGWLSAWMLSGGRMSLVSMGGLLAGLLLMASTGAGWAQAGLYGAALGAVGFGGGVGGVALWWHALARREPNDSGRKER